MADMITQYLASRGAAPSAENASRVRQHYASNPDLLDRRALGLPGGLDDNSAVLDAMLDKHVAESMPTPQGSVEVGAPVKAESVPPPSRTAPAQRGPADVGGTKPTGTSRQAGYGPATDASNRQANYDAPTAAPTGVSGDLTGASYASGSQIGPTQQSDITGWLLGLLGAGSMGALGYGINKQARRDREAREAGPLPGTTPPDGSNARDVTSQVQVDTTDPATMRARMQAEIDAENDAMYRQMEQDAVRQRSQRNTEDLARAARRATGRR